MIRNKISSSYHFYWTKFNT